MGGRRVISWALVFAQPILIPALLFSDGPWILHAPSLRACLGLAWLCFGSMFLGFVFWYQGLAQAGITRVSQVQLALPMLSLFWAHAILGESVAPRAYAVSLLVAACMLVCISRRVP
jgi:drug/metabolite transporter (DMT)-like permease